MNLTRPKGYSLLIILVGISLAGFALLQISRGGKDLLHQTNQMQLDNTCRNLTASALAWCKTQAKELTQRPVGEQILLDTEAFQLPEASITVTIKKKQPDAMLVEINSFVSSKRLPARHKGEYWIK